MFIFSSKSFRALTAIVSRISPHIADKIEITAIKPLTINVGKRGTNHVVKKSPKIGKNIISAKIISKSETEPKNFKGR